VYFTLLSYGTCDSEYLMLIICYHRAVSGHINSAEATWPAFPLQVWE